MSLGSPDMPEAPNPAKRPERRSSVKPEDVVVADQEQDNGDDQRGRRALRRPAGSSGNDVGTGLSA